MIKKEVIQLKKENNWASPSEFYYILVRRYLKLGNTTLNDLIKYNIKTKGDWSEMIDDLENRLNDNLVESN